MAGQSQKSQAPKAGVSWSTQSANFVRHAIAPALLLFVCPFAVNLFSFVLINKNFDYGNFYMFVSQFAELLFVQQDSVKATPTIKNVNVCFNIRPGVE